MIKLDRVSWKIETDCRTVGEFMTEAAALFGGHVDIIVDGCRYEFHDTPKIKVTDDTPIGTVVWDYHGGGMFGGSSYQFTILTKPKPKTIRRKGLVNVYANGEQRITGKFIYPTTDAAKIAEHSEGYHKVAIAHIEWEEVPE